MNQYTSWEAIQKSQREGLPPTVDPTLVGPAATVPRIRREYGARDQINSRAWDFFHATPPTNISTADLQKAGAPVLYDMKPIASRINNVQYRLQPSYMPDPPRGTTTSDDLGVAPPSGTVAPPSTTFSGSFYTQRLDAGGSDARNMIRELRSAVVEDNRELSTDADRHLTQRQFSDRWLPLKAATDAQSLQAYDLLRPRLDDWRNAWAGDDKS